MAAAPTPSANREQPAPPTAPRAVSSCSRIACFLLHPDCTKMARSPTSWGTSWRRTVNAVTVPTVGPATNDAPMANPSVTLWATSAARFR